MSAPTASAPDPAGLPLTLPHAAQRAAQAFAAAPALVDGPHAWSFAELWHTVRQTAASFAALGLGANDVIGIWAPNSPHWIFAALAAQLCGAAVVPMNTRYRGQEAADLLRRSRTKLLVLEQGFLNTDYAAMLAGEDLPDLAHIITTGASSENCLAWGDLPPAGLMPEDALDRVHPDMLSDILFTSGTTGRPKGVMCSHRQSVRAFDTWSRGVDLRQGDRYLIVNPFFHVFGYKAGWFSCLLRGATAYPLRNFDVAACLDLITSARITFFPGPPTIFQTILSGGHHQSHDLSSLRVGVTGAASVPPSLIRAMREDIGFHTVLTAYGLTECTGVVSLCQPGDDDETIATSCGKPIPGIEVIIADDAGQPLPAGQTGEILVRGYNVMAGYLDDPTATAETIDAQGWLHTGDVGTQDERGYLRITDRKKEMYISGGFNCYPAEIERMLSAHPAIAMVAVIGIPDPRMGEIGRALVVRKPGTTLTDSELTSWAREQMANYKVPRQITFVDSIPVNASGKIHRAALRTL